MTTKDCKMQNMPWISPYICVLDVDKAIDFYRQAFGFEVQGEVSKGEDGQSVHCELKYQDTVVMLGLQGAFGATSKTPLTSSVESPISLYVYCEDVNALYKHALKEGAISLSEPEETFWGDRMCRLKDPNGYVWAFATHLGQAL